MPSPPQFQPRVRQKFSVEFKMTPRKRNVVQDHQITSVWQLHLNDVVSGSICNITDLGLFVTLGHRRVTAFVRVSNLSDSYIKDWKAEFRRNQLVKGRIVSLDPEAGRIQMSLKNSVMKPDYVPALTFNDLSIGQLVAGKVAKVEDFGVFVVVDNSANVRGLCHRSELAEHRVDDARKFFNEGDMVKAKVLKLDIESRRISFGLKASYFSKQTDEEDGNGEVSHVASKTSPGDVQLAGYGKVDDDDTDGSTNGSIELDSGLDSYEDGEDLDPARMEIESESESDTQTPVSTGLQVGGFDWQGLSNPPKKRISPSSTSGFDHDAPPKSRKRHKASIQADLTGELDTYGPQSASDFERLLISEPDSSLLWLQYMAMYLSLGEVSTARHIGHRALQTISPLGQSESEKLNIWIALLNLENSYSDNEAIEATFKSACQVNDPQEVHERLASIYIQSSKTDEADALFQTMIRKFGARDLKIWVNYATFLFDTLNEPDRGRGLLSRALQTLPSQAHIDITVKFATLEFRSKGNGIPERGRTIFEGLIDSFPKRVDLWNVLLDLEMRYIGSLNQDSGEQIQKTNKKNKNKSENGTTTTTTTTTTTDSVRYVRRIFERLFNSHSTKLKNKQARFFFKRWLDFEEKLGDERSVDTVKRRAQAWVRDRQGK